MKFRFRPLNSIHRVWINFFLTSDNSFLTHSYKLIRNKKQTDNERIEAHRLVAYYQERNGT